MRKNTAQNKPTGIRRRKGVETLRGPRKAAPFLPNKVGLRWENGKQIARKG
jgi:hypothetical protein